MKRRHVLTSLGSFVAGLVGGSVVGSRYGRRAEPAAPMVAAGGRTLSMVTEWPDAQPGFGTSAQRFARRVAAASDNRLVIEVYPVGTKHQSLESFDAVSAGEAHMMHAAPHFWVGKAPGFAFFGSAPMGMNIGELQAWLYHGGGGELWDELGARFNLKPFACGGGGSQMGGWFRREINSVEDFLGMRARIAGLGGEVFKRAGGKLVNLPPGQLFQALQEGTLDGGEWFGPWHDASANLHEAARFYYYPGFHEPASGTELSFNLETWQGFSPVEQEILKACIAAEGAHTLAEYNARNAEALERLKRAGQVELRPFPQEAYRALARATRELLEDLARADSLTERIYKSYVDFQSRAIGWTSVSTQAFAEQRRLALDSIS